MIGHEIAHIANGDMITMTLLQGVINAFVMFLARVLAFFFSSLGRDRRGKSGGSYFSYRAFTFLFEVVFMILGSLLLAAFSRLREFRADKGSALLLGKEPMIQALRKLEASSAHAPHSLEKHESIAAFMIYRPSKRSWVTLFSTHPPIEERIQRLQDLA